ncbi:MAG: N-6 DNA methylase [Candidatus Aenigmatarchaeota archaeon]
MDKEIIKEEIQKLINEFNADKESYKKLSEADTETRLIEPLFQLLGWERNDFDKQSQAHRGSQRGRADYAFKINGRTVFFLEVKKVGVSLDREADKQVISYALSKRVPFAVSTNFEETRIFCVEEENSIRNKFRVFNTPEDYINSFEDLLFLSKNSFEENIILKKAEDEGRLKKRVSIDKTLLNDLMLIRSLIASDIEKTYAKKYSIDEKDDIVQRILDRLIFIRRCEDININPDGVILSDIKHLHDSKAYTKLKEIFKTYDDVYNSGLFAISRDNDCDTININGSIIKNLIYYLYESKDKTYIYNFDWIDADVLGQVYEQYLGLILDQKKSGKAQLRDSRLHRKEQGIYYTPTYVVDYIIRNTLGELITDKKTKPLEIKILDPACGSGSFLIKSFDHLLNSMMQKPEAKQMRLDYQGIYSVKTHMLKNNFYGVDLDNKAVEITKLNLLLKAAEKGRKLPTEIDTHICHGNSLIDAEEVAGLDSFKWIDDFEGGSFDIIIGNPPYVDIKQLDPLIVKYLFSAYETVENRMNLYSVFVEKSFRLLKNGGYFGFIIPNSILYNQSYSKIRKLLLNEATLKKIVRLPDNVFEKAKVETIILIYQKKKPTKSTKCELLIYPSEEKISFIDKENCNTYTTFNQLDWSRDNIINISRNPTISKIIKKIEEGTKPLIDLCDFSLGLTPYDKYKGHTQDQIKNKVFHSETKKNETFKPLLSGAGIIRYGIKWNQTEYISYGKWLGAPREQRFFLKPRIVVRQIISGKPPKIYAGYTEKELYNTQIGFNIIPKNGSSDQIKYILAILNSKLMTFYHKEKYLDPSKRLFQKILIANTKKFPIKLVSKETEKDVINLVDKIISMNNSLNEIGDKKTDRRVHIENEIQRIDKEIDSYIYRIYGITEEEKKIIEKI